MGEREIHHYVRDAGYIPAKRDTHYTILQVFENAEDSENVPSLPVIQTSRKQEAIPLLVS